MLKPHLLRNGQISNSINVHPRWAQLVSSHFGRTLTWTEIHSEYHGAKAYLNFLLKALSQNGCRHQENCLIHNCYFSFNLYVFVVAFTFRPITRPVYGSGASLSWTSLMAASLSIIFGCMGVERLVS